MPFPVIRDPAPMLEAALREWGGQEDLWVFGYASLIWRPEFEYAERRVARVHGWHRALRMWSRINRGTPECPGLVFALLSGGSCQGVVFRVPQVEGRDVMQRLWDREMLSGVYDPRWLHCQTADGPVKALAFTLARSSPNFTGELQEAHYRQIFSESCGRFGTTLDYAQQTYDGLLQLGIHDHELARVLQHAPAQPGQRKA